MMRKICFALLLPWAAATMGSALAQPCLGSDNGGGTADLPPAGGGFAGPAGLSLTIDDRSAGVPWIFPIT